MRSTLTYIEYAMFAVSVISLFFIMFLVGDTDILAEPPTWVTMFLTVTAAVSAVIGAGLHWVGLPTKGKPASKKKKR
jgi:hypothetical protein